MKFPARRSALLLALTIALGLSHPIPAVHLNPDGLGQVLIYPYYTVNADNATLLSIVNTKARGKAVRVRILEGYNGQEVLDFNVFLSGYDVWTASIFALTATGPGNLLTDDETCTIPDIKGSTGSGTAQLPPPDGRTYIPFRTQQLQTDGGPKTADRTREGSIEIIELASLAAGSPLETATFHVNGLPPGCTGLNNTVNANLTDLLRPTGGLFGSAGIVNPQLGTLIGYNADAVDGFYLLDSNLYTGSEFASLANVRTTTTTAVAYNYVPTSTDGPYELVSSTYTATNAIDAVSAIFTASRVANEYVIEANSASESEWVLTFPTKKFYVNTGTVGIPPFVRRFAAPGRSCVLVGVRYFDREERKFEAECPNICPEVPTPTLCFQTNVLSFRKAADYTASSGTSAVLGSRLTQNLDPRGDTAFESGWLRLDMDPRAIPSEPHALRASVDLDVYHGLPVTGFLATNYLNRNNGGPNVLSTYSVGSRHRAQRDCSNTTQGGDGFCD